MFRLFATVTGGWVTFQTPLIAPLGDGECSGLATVTGGWVTVQTPLIAPLGNG
jgi:hypothetical protein